MLFQDQTGGLELRDPQTGEFIHADPEDGTLVLNIGDMLGRFTNGKLLRRHRSGCCDIGMSLFNDIRARRLLQVR